MYLISSWKDVGTSFLQQPPGIPECQYSLNNVTILHTHTATYILFENFYLKVEFVFSLFQPVVTCYANRSRLSLFRISNDSFIYRFVDFDTLIEWEMMWTMFVCRSFNTHTYILVKWRQWRCTWKFWIQCDLWSSFQFEDWLSNFKV